MFKKKLTYIILLIVFSLVLCGDLAIYFAVPEAGGNGPENFSMEVPEDFGEGDFNPEDVGEGEIPEDAMEDSGGESSPESSASESTSGEAGIEDSANDSTSGEATNPEDPTGDASEYSGQEDAQSGDISTQQPEGERVAPSENAQMPEMPEGEGMENGGFRPGQGMPTGGFISSIKSAFVPILIVCVLVDGWSIFMLIRLKKRAKQGDV